MKRVMIMGSPGAGKSTFARKLGALIGAPVIHMDTLYWNPGWVGCEPVEFHRRAVVAHEGDAWVSDGDYTTVTGEIRIPRAEAIIWIEQPRWRCVARVLTRWAKNLGGTREDLAPGCPEQMELKFIGFVWNYPADLKPRQHAAIARFGGQDRLITLQGDRAQDAYLATLANALAPPRAGELAAKRSEGAALPLSLTAFDSSPASGGASVVKDGAT